jgi:molybdate transport system regulatory protein
MNLKIRLTILNSAGQPFMGRGPVQLLSGIARHRSIQQAAKEMNLSYVKALKIVKNLEESLGCQLLTRTIGGKNHGGAELTPFAREFLGLFSRYEQKIATLAELEFSEFIEKFQELKGKIS